MCVADASVSPMVVDQMSGKTPGKILAILRDDAHTTIPEMASAIGVTERTIERKISELQSQGMLERAGPAKAGHWKVAESNK
ncbi:hypothetical protein AB833_22865 [Chromatiales bacterium (ex Bugula neritina AB1)]|nr:hypothetical protein AB833_22865 [Chromatiales bacterium (ex Bugula neritina AB1)]